MKPGDPVADLLRTPEHAGAPAEGAKTGLAGSVRRGCAVQLSATRQGTRLRDVRYHAFGGPEFIAACEYVARAAEGAELAAASDARAVQWLEALDLQRDALAALLVLEDAWHKLVAAHDAAAEET